MIANRYRFIVLLSQVNQIIYTDKTIPSRIMRMDMQI